MILTTGGPRGGLETLNLVLTDLNMGLFHISTCTLGKAKSFSSENSRCCLFAENAQPGEWVQGIGWNEVTWGGPNPNKRWLDEVCAYNPVIIHRMCWHKAVISSSAGNLPYKILFEALFKHE